MSPTDAYVETAGRAYSFSMGRSSSGERRTGDLRELRRQEREESKRRTRHALMVAGLDAVIESGLDVSLAEICERAGYSRGAFYVHFRDRQEFLAAIADWMFNAMLDSFIADENAPDDLAVSAQRFTHALSTGQWPLIPRIRVAAVRLMEAINRWPEIRQSFDDFTARTMEKIENAARTGQQMGYVRSDLDPHAVAAMFIVTGTGWTLLHDAGLAIDYQEQAETLLRLISTPAAPTADAEETPSVASGSY
jgi:TetR/AcrR family transcriptional repressor of nem operon